MPSFGKLVLSAPGTEELTFELAKAEISIGRDPAGDIVLRDRRVSRAHARLACGEDGCFLADLGSPNGTTVNGDRVQRARLAPGDLIRIGDSTLRFETASPADLPDVVSIDTMADLEQTFAQDTVSMTLNDTSFARLVVHTPDKIWEVPLGENPLVIGRHPDSDIHIPHLKLSRQHARIERREEGFFIVDLGSANGTWLGSTAIDGHLLQTGDTIRVGPGRLVFKEGFGSADLTLVDEPTAKAGAGHERVPVVVVPGLMGSELWQGSERVWPNVRTLFTNPEVYSLQENPSLEPRGIVNEVVIVPNLVKQEQYNRLGDFLVDSLGYKRNVDLLEFGYDWRKDVRDSARQLAQAIEDWDVAGPVVLIGHSLGTLVSRYYIEREGGKNRVKQAILLGGPHYGVPKAVTSLSMKADLLPFGLLGDRLRQVLSTFPSFYQILPIYGCVFDQRGQPIQVFDDDRWLPEAQRPLLHEARAFRRELGRRLSVPSVSVFGYGLKTIDRVNVTRDPSGAWTSVDLVTKESGDSTIPDASTVLEGSEIHPVAQYHGSLYIDNDVKMRLKLELSGLRARA